MPLDLSYEDPDTVDRYNGNLDGLRDRVDAERGDSGSNVKERNDSRSRAEAIVDFATSLLGTAYDMAAEFLGLSDKREIEIARGMMNAKSGAAKATIQGDNLVIGALTVAGEVAPGPVGASLTAAAETAAALQNGYQPGDLLGPTARGVAAGLAGLGAGAVTGLATANPVAAIGVGGTVSYATDALIGDAIESHAANLERGVIDAARAVPGALEAVHNTYHAGVQSMVDAAIAGRVGNFRPVVIDLDGDGFEVIGRTLSSVAFDMDGDGFREQVAWVAPHDGLLVMDLSTSGARTPDGHVTHYREFAFANVTPENDTDLEAFARLYDSNRDGKFNAQDSAFSLARIWRDLDQDAIVDAHEMRPLAAHGITEIGLRHSSGSYTNRTDDRTVDGTTLFGVSYMIQNGAVRQGRVGDIQLGTNPTGFRDVATSQGNLLEIETAQRVRSLELQGRGSANVNLHTANLDSVIGDARANLLDARGATHNRVMVGMGGDDVIHGGNGHDHLDGGSGRDRLFGGNGQDVIVFDSTDLEVRGGSGYDTGVVGNNTAVSINLWTMQLEMLLSGDGSDRIVTDSRSAQDHFIYGGGGNDTITSARGHDRVVGGSGNDTIHLGAGNDQADGGTGNDRIYGQDHNDRLFGLDGDDLLDGGTGADFLSGGAGRDTLVGGAGSDRIQGDAGDDRLTGGADADRFLFGAGFGRDVITDFQFGQDRIVFTGNGLADRLSDLTITPKTMLVPAFIVHEMLPPHMVMPVLSGFTVGVKGQSIDVTVSQPAPFAAGRELDMIATAFEFA